MSFGDDTLDPRNVDDQLCKELVDAALLWVKHTRSVPAMPFSLELHARAQLEKAANRLREHRR